MIPTLLIDDEQHNINILKALLDENCPKIHILDSACHVDEAFDKIKRYQPKLIFLDVKMPEKTGFDLLRQFTEINFEIIFVSAFNDYAIKAFEFNALDYILKPIDYTKLIKAVQRAEKRISENAQNKNLLHFVKTIDEKNNLIRKLTFHHKDKVVIVDINDILFIKSDNDICIIKTKNNTNYNSSKRLNLFEDVLKASGNFIRITRSVIVNIHAIKSYSKGEPCYIELESDYVFETSRRKKGEILNALKTKLS